MRFVRFVSDYAGEAWINTEGITLVNRASDHTLPPGVTVGTNIYYQAGGPYTIFGLAPEEVLARLAEGEA